MMKKQKGYDRTRFTPEVLRDAIGVFRSVAGNPKEKSTCRCIMQVTVNGEEWTHQSEEEFFADCRKSMREVWFTEHRNGFDFTFHSIASGNRAVVTVEAPQRGTIESVFEVFEKNATASRLPEKKDPPPPPLPPPPPPAVFIGHGRSPMWRDLKDHLQEKHGISVEAYEIGARAGHGTRDILESMLKKSSMALLVMSGEDETTDGKLRARENVVHEAGLFQGRLGFKRAIILLEKGVEEFSNIQGVEQIRFSRGNIKETFGDVVAVIKREFPAYRQEAKAIKSAE